MGEVRLDAQVGGLVVVCCAAAGQVGQEIEAELAVRLGILNDFTLGSRLGLGCVCGCVAEGKGFESLGDEGRKARHGQPRKHACMQPRVL